MLKTRRYLHMEGECDRVTGMGLPTPSFIKRSGTVIGGYMASQMEKWFDMVRWGQLPRYTRSYIYSRRQKSPRVYATEARPVY